MFATALEQQGWQIDLQELVEFCFIVGYMENLEVNLLDKIQLLLLSGGVCHDDSVG